MDLLTTEVTNFRKFEKKSVDWSPSKFWIVSGPNGAGKSSLVADALTFALFGNCQPLEKSDLRKSDILRNGAKDLSVKTKFRHEGHIYTFERRQSQSGGPRTRVWVDSRKNPIVDGGGSAGVQKTIEILGMDYDTFVRTAVIRQHEMTNYLELGPKDRQDALKKIFRLEMYSDFSKSASKLASEKKTDVKVLEDRIKREEDIVEDIEGLKKEKSHFNDKLENLEASIKATRDQLGSNEKMLSNLRKKEEERAIFVQKTKDASSSIDKGKKSLSKIIAEKEKIEQDLKNLPEIEKRLTEMGRLKAERDELLEHYQQFQLMEKEVSHLSSLIGNEKQKLLDQKKDAESKLKRIAKEVKELKKDVSKKKKLQNIELKKINEQIEALGPSQQQYEDFQKKEKKILKLEGQITEIQGEIKEKKSALKAEIAALEKDADRLEKAKKDHDRLDEEYQSLSAQLKDQKILTKKYERLAKELENEQGLKAKLEQQETQIKAQMHEWGFELQQLQKVGIGAKCPKCKQILSKDHYDRVCGKLEANIAQYQNNLDKTVQKRNLRENYVKQKLSERKQVQDDLKKIESRIKNLKKIEGTLENLEKQLESGSAIYEELEEKKALIKSGSAWKHLTITEKKIKDEIEEASFSEDDFGKAKKASEDLKALLIRQSKISGEITNLPQLAENYEKKKKELKDQQKSLDETNRILSTEVYATDLREQLEKAKSSRAKLQQKAEEFEKLGLKIAAFDEDSLRERLQKLHRDQERKKQLENQANELGSSLEELENQLQSYKEEIRKLGDLDQERKKLEQKKIEFQAELEKQLGEKEKTRNSLENIVQRISISQKKTKEIKKLRGELEAHKLDKEALDFLKGAKGAFEKTAAQILHRIRSKLQIVASIYLTRLSEGEMSRLYLRDDFSLRVERFGEEKPVKFFSGGEKTRIAMAFRLALSRALAGGQTRFETLIIDEGEFGTLDQEGREAVKDMFRHLEPDFKRMILITHIEDIAEEFQDNVIQLEK